MMSSHVVRMAGLRVRIECPVRMPGPGVRHNRGIALVLFVILLGAFLSICALAIDLGMGYVAAAQLQNIADAAALAGAGRLREGLSQEEARAEAIAIAAANSVLKEPQILEPGDVVFGSWDESSRELIPWDETVGRFAVEVTVRRTEDSPNGPIPTFFARIFNVRSMNISRSAVACVDAVSQPRNPVKVMIVQDASTSFQSAWAEAIAADAALFEIISEVSVPGDAVGIVAFNGRLPDSWLKEHKPYPYGPTYYQIYRLYPFMNEGIKYTTDRVGYPLLTDERGYFDPNGQVRPMAGELTQLNSEDTDPTEYLEKVSSLLENGNAWGDTDTAAGLNYAIDRLLENTSGGGEKVIILVSDGRPHDLRGPEYTEMRELAAIQAAERAEREGIKIHTVTLEGIDGANFEFNRGLVRNGGTALRAASAEDLRDLLIGIGKTEVGRPRLVK